MQGTGNCNAASTKLKRVHSEAVEQTASLRRASAFDFDLTRLIELIHSS